MTTPAGWYDDGSGKQRWWDGSQWTDTFQDVAPTPPTAPADATFNAPPETPAALVPPTMPISGAPTPPSAPSAPGVPVPPGGTQVLPAATAPAGSNKNVKIAIAAVAAIALLGGAGAGVWALTKGDDTKPVASSTTSSSPSSSASATDSPSSSSSSSITIGGSEWDSLSESERENFKSGFLTGMRKADLPIDWDDASAECMGRKLVNAIGMDKLQEYGLEGGDVDFTDNPMSHSDAKAMSNAVVTCAPDDGAIAYFESKFDEGMGDSVTAAQRSCMHDKLGRQIWIDLLTSQYDGESATVEADLQEKAKDAAQVCLT